MNRTAGVHTSLPALKRQTKPYGGHTRLGDFHLPHQVWRHRLYVITYELLRALHMALQVLPCTAPGGAVHTDHEVNGEFCNMAAPGDTMAI